MKDLLIHNVKICLSDKILDSNILIRDGKINRIGVNENEISDGEKIDAHGNYLLPGFIDVHTHLDDTINNYNLADTYKSGTKIAIQNGITSLYSFITQSMDETLSESIDKVKDKAVGNSFCNIGWHLTPTNYSGNNLDDLKQLLRNEIKSVKLYTTYKEAGIYSSYEQIKQIAETVKEYKGVVLVHCEDEAALKTKISNEYNLADAFCHSLLCTEEAEIVAVKNIIKIAEETKARFHIVHVSTPEAIALINEAKKETDVTCETGPQYLLFNNSLLEGEDGFRYLCTPPFRDESSQISLYERAINDDIDLYATDHCVFTKKDKSQFRNDLMKVPKGLPGIGALVPMIYEMNKYKGENCFLHMAKHLSENPARLVSQFPKKGIIQEGRDADLVLLGLGEKRKIKSTDSDSYDPYEDYETDLNICKVFLKGVVVVENNLLINNDLPKGEMI